MNKQNQWLFEAPVTSEVTLYKNPYNNPEWEAERELTESFPLNEEEWETVSRLKVPRRSVPKRPGRVSRSCPPVQSTQPRIVDGWGQYKQRVQELPLSQQAILRKIGNEIRMSYQPGCQPVRKVQVFGHADRDTPPNQPRNIQREKQMSEERARMVTSWLKNYVGKNIASRITWDPQGFGATKLKAPSTTEANRRQNRRVEILIFTNLKEKLPTVRIEVAPSSPKALTAQLSELESSAVSGVSIQPSSIIVPIGQEIEVIATGDTLERGSPGYTWSIDNLIVATLVFAQGNDSQSHPNRVKVTGKSVGMATISVIYKDRSGKTTIAQRNVIVTKVEALELDDPPGDPVMPPRNNELVRPQLLRLGGVAKRTIKVKFEPVTFWAGKEAQWMFTPIGRVRGTLPTNHSTNLETKEGFNFTPANQRSIINPDGTTAIRVNMPPISFNRGQVEIAAVNFPSVKTVLNFEVPGIVVLDPGHGGDQNLSGSSQNNATSVSGVREKNMTLDMAKLVQTALGRHQIGKIHVFMTREDDVNLEGAARAGIARCNGADIFLSIHFNGSSDPRTRGTETFVRAIKNKNVNRSEDLALARRINNAVIAAIPNSRDRGVKDDNQTKPGSLAVLSDESLGNTAISHPTRSCLVEIEFITNPDVDRLFNTSQNRLAFRQQLANAISNAIVEDLQNQP